MKNIKYIGAILLTIVLTLSIQSCSKDEGPGEEPVNPPVEEPSVPSVQAKKRISEITTANESSRTTIKFKYNEDNKLQSVEADNFHLSYNYGENKIVVNNQPYTIEYTYDSLLQKKKVIKNGEGEIEYSFTFDEKNRLIQFQNIKHTWEGDNIIQTVDTISQRTAAYSYSSEKNNCSSDFDPLIYMMQSREDHYTFMIFSELLGTRCKNLIRKRIEKFEENTTVSTYDYDFDTDGYITHIHETSEQEFDGEKITAERDFYLNWIQ